EEGVIGVLALASAQPQQLLLRSREASLVSGLHPRARPQEQGMRPIVGGGLQGQHALTERLHALRVVALLLHLPERHAEEEPASLLGPAATGPARHGLQLLEGLGGTVPVALARPGLA